MGLENIQQAITEKKYSEKLFTSICLLNQTSWNKLVLSPEDYTLLMDFFKIQIIEKNQQEEGDEQGKMPPEWVRLCRNLFPHIREDQKLFLAQHLILNIPQRPELFDFLWNNLSASSRTSLLQTDVTFQSSYETVGKSIYIHWYSFDADLIDLAVHCASDILLYKIIWRLGKNLADYKECEKQIREVNTLIFTNANSGHHFPHTPYTQKHVHLCDMNLEERVKFLAERNTKFKSNAQTLLSALGVFSYIEFDVSEESLEKTMQVFFEQYYNDAYYEDLLQEFDRLSTKGKAVFLRVLKKSAFITDIDNNKLMLACAIIPHLLEENNLENKAVLESARDFIRILLSATEGNISAQIRYFLEKHVCESQSRKLLFGFLSTPEQEKSAHEATLALIFDKKNLELTFKAGNAATDLYHTVMSEINAKKSDYNKKELKAWWQNFHQAIYKKDINELETLLSYRESPHRQSYFSRAITRIGQIGMDEKMPTLIVSLARKCLTLSENEVEAYETFIKDRRKNIADLGKEEVYFLNTLPDIAKDTTEGTELAVLGAKATMH